MNDIFLLCRTQLRKKEIIFMSTKFEITPMGLGLTAINHSEIKRTYGISQKEKKQTT